MAKYLYEVNYSIDGTKGLLREGGSSRRDMVKQMTEKLGGKLEAFYFASGQRDAYVIVDVPNAAGAEAVRLAVNASGGAHCTMIALLEPEQIDEAVRQTVSYRPPGG